MREILFRGKRVDNGEKSMRKENLCAFVVSVVEIIGNIHDNPELLDGVRNG